MKECSKNRLWYALILAVLLGSGCLFQGSNECANFIDFEDLPVGAEFSVGDTVTHSGVTATIWPFQWAGGTWTTGGSAVIDNDGDAGGKGQDMMTNNVSLKFMFENPRKGLSLLFGEYGGNVNLEINGVFKNVDSFLAVNGTTLGGVKISVAMIDSDKGELTLSGDIISFAIGGQELWIDDICFE